MANIRNGMNLDGGLELVNLLRELPKRVEKKGHRAAITAACTPIARAAKASAPRESGLLKKAIGKKVKSYSRGTVAGIIGAKRAIQGQHKGKNRVPANYLHLVEKGTSHSAAQPFLEDAYNANKDAAAQIAKDKLATVVEAEARKLGKL